MLFFLIIVRLSFWQGVIYFVMCQMMLNAVFLNYSSSKFLARCNILCNVSNDVECCFFLIIVRLSFWQGVIYFVMCQMMLNAVFLNYRSSKFLARCNILCNVSNDVEYCFYIYLIGL